MRTNEARWLKRSDVNLVDGVININQSKGANQHRVALHESMLRLLERYDENMAKVMPDRTCSFPNKNDCFHRPALMLRHVPRLLQSGRGRFEFGRPTGR